MTPVQFLARLCALIPPPRHPLVRFHGVFAPHSSWRADVVELVAPAPCPVSPPRAPPGLAPSKPTSPPRTCVADKKPRVAPRIDWATLLRRVYDFDALVCPCGGRLRVIALIIDTEVTAAILTALHLPSTPPPIARARAPNDFDDFDDLAS